MARAFPSLPLTAHVVGPTYLDLTVSCDGPIAEGFRFDATLEALEWRPASSGLIVSAEEEQGIEVSALPGCQEFPHLECRLNRPLIPGRGPWRKRVVPTAFRVDLGGMGAGYATALSAATATHLWSWHGEDEAGDRVESLMARRGVNVAWQKVAGRKSDQTILISSSAGDKLGIGLRDAIHGLEAGGLSSFARNSSLLVLAGVPNRVLGNLLSDRSPAFVVFAPSLRNIEDKTWPLTAWARHIDLLTLNRREWESLEGREQFLSGARFVAITDGPAGAELLAGGRSFRAPAFHPAKAVASTNHAGEAFATALMLALVQGRDPQRALREGLAAADLKIDYDDFRFPTPDEWQRHAG